MPKTISASNCKYYSIRLGKVPHGGAGDFIDNIDSTYNLAVIEFPDQEMMAIQGKNIKFFVEEDCWALPIEKLVNNFQTAIPHNVLAGLYRSAMEQNDGGLVIHDALNESGDNFFESTDQVDVSEFGACVFGICSVTTNLSLEVDMTSGVTKYDGRVFETLSDLYGHFDEDEWWVVGVRS